MSRINVTYDMLTKYGMKLVNVYVCRLTSALYNSKQIWNEDKCRCECKEDLVNQNSVG